MKTVVRRRIIDGRGDASDFGVKIFAIDGQLGRLGIVRVEQRNLHGLGEMKFARPAIIVKPIGDVGMLLYFAERKPRADGVDCAHRDEECIAGVHVHPVQQLLNLSA